MKHFIQTIRQRSVRNQIMLTFTVLLITSAGLGQTPSQPTMPDSIRCSPHIWGAPRDSINGLGEVTYYYLTYVFVRKETQINTRKEITFIEKDGFAPTDAASEWITITNDTLFKWLSNQLPIIRHENLLEAIIQDIYDGDTTYYPIRGSHPTMSTFYLYSKSSNIQKTVQESSIRPFYREQLKNLNYAYNTSTSLYKFYTMLMQRIEYLGKLYVFKSVKH